MPRNQRPLSQTVPALMEAAGVRSLRQLASECGCSVSFLSRVVSGQKPPSRELLEALAGRLGVDREHFPEYRALSVIEATGADARLRDRLYDQLPPRWR